MIQLKESTEEDALVAAFGYRVSGRVEAIMNQFRMITAEYDGELAGAILIKMINPVLADVHIGILPRFRGQIGRRIGKAWLGFIWDNTSAQRVSGTIRSDNRLAIRYARSMGLEEYGFNERSMMWNGKIYDTVLMGVSRVSV